MSYSKLLRWTSRAASFTLLVIVLVVWKAGVTSTQGPLAQKNEPSRPAEIKRPIISIMVASSIDATGRLVNPRFTFPQNEPQITAVVWVGKIKGSELTITWFKIFENGGHETLFDHKIQVKSNERAFSVAKNASGTLELGTYKVVASLEGQTEEIEFDISPPRKAPKKTSNSRDDELFEDQARSRNIDGAFSVGTNGLPAVSKFEPVAGLGVSMQRVSWNAASRTARATQAGSAVAQGKRPVSGQSGTAPQPPKPPSGPTASGCSMVIGGENPALLANILKVYSWGACPSALDEISVSAIGSDFDTIQAVLGNYQTLGAAAGTSKIFPVNPCSVGSDLPGTKVTVKAFASDINNNVLGNVSQVITLGEDTLAPRVLFDTTPPSGNPVKEGDQINLNVKAQERRINGPWQTGVQMIQIIPNDLVKEPPWVNPSKLPKPCSGKTWEQPYQATYTVPKNPGSTIKICASAQDYVPNEYTKCVEFPVIPKSVMPANCKNKGSAHVNWKDGSPAMGAFDSKSPNYEMVECHFRWGICKKGYSWTHVGKNADGCQSFFDSSYAKLPKEEFCCDCYPECASKAPATKKKR